MTRKIREIREKPEPLIRRRFTAESGAQHMSGMGDVDTGANATNLTRTIACRLVPTLGRPDAVGVTNGGDVGGNLIEVLLRVGKRTAPIRAFVPAVVFLPDGSARDIEGHNLIGLDFLRATKPVLDFRRRRGRELLQGAGVVDPGRIIRFRSMTKAESALTAHLQCPGPSRK